MGEVLQLQAELMRDFIFMQISEKELENYLFDYLNGGLEPKLQLRGFKVIDPFFNYKWVRQLNIDPYGIADIVGFARHKGTIYIELIELKVVPITMNDIEQINRYRTGISRYLENTFKNPRYVINCNLIGSEYDGFYSQNYMDIGISSFYYDLEGVWFNQTPGFSKWFNKGDKSKSFRLWRNSGTSR